MERKLERKTILDWDQNIFIETRPVKFDGSNISYISRVCSKPTYELYNPQTIRKIEKRETEDHNFKVSRTTEVFYPDTFVIESDTLSQEEQLDQAYNLVEQVPVLSIVNSGHKSIHTVVKIMPHERFFKLCEEDPSVFKMAIRRFVNKYGLRGCDEACWNINRLTRTPNAKRSDGSDQICYFYEPHNRLNFTKDLNIVCDEYESQKVLLATSFSKPSVSYNGPTRKYSSIEEHMDAIKNRSEAYYAARRYLDYNADWNDFASAICYFHSIGYTYEDIAALKLEGKWDLKGAWRRLCRD